MRQTIVVTMLLGVFAIAAAIAFSVTPLAEYARVSDPLRRDEPRATGDQGAALIAALRWFAEGASRLDLDDGRAEAPISIPVVTDPPPGGDSEALGLAAAKAPASAVSAPGDGRLPLLGSPAAILDQNQTSATAPPQPAVPVAVSEYNLGMMYLDGRGVARDYAVAARHLLAAAERGNALAQAALGDLYHQGLGVARNDVAAYAWFDLAATAAPAPTEAREAAAKRDRLASLLTPDELEAARLIVAAWKPKTDAA